MASRVAQRQAGTTKLALTAIFLGGFAAFITHAPFRRRHARRLDLPGTDLLLLVGSTLRLGRLVAFDQVFEPVRAPFTNTEPDESGAGNVVVPKGEGAQQAVGELIACPICSGTWIAAALVYALHLFPGPARIFMTIMSTIGLAEMLNALTESWSWAGAAARKQAGTG